MIVTRSEILSAMANVKDFEIVKNNENTDGSILARWKGSVFFITFNTHLIKKIDSESQNDENAIIKKVSSDFTITFVTSFNDDDKISTIAKYKIINFANMKSNLGAVFIYREDVDAIEIQIRHSVYLRENGTPQITGGVMRMVLIGVVAINEMMSLIATYNNDPETFLKDCGGIR